MTVTHGFELLREEEIEERQATARLYRHLQSGAELLSLETADENKSFGIAFRTPPPDSTGLPHIMEHSVLGGSEKYPLKEPFLELVKGSMKTFLNALTFADMTMYPVASTNTQDFYNLVDVYMDAVLNPLITPNHLAQEGWHLELENVDDPLIYKGVVFNEMKGAYSSPEGVLFRYTKQAMFPDNAYRHDSGGDPAVMPNLTYEQFRSFHETYYHPSNSRIFFYGDDDPEQRLKLLDSYLSQFEAVEVDTAVSIHAPFAKPQRFTFPYSVEADGDNSQKHYVVLNWVLPPIDDDTLLRWALSILSVTLLSKASSPLRKTLVDSGLGEDVIGGGFSARMRQPTFSVGMKGVLAENIDAVEALILATLAQLAEDGFEPEAVEAAVNSIEFSLRENNTGSFPRGLSLMMGVMPRWMRDGDPLAALKFERPLTAVKEAIANDPIYLPRLIRSSLLDNNHRGTIVLEPDATLQQRQETAEKEKLATIKARLNEVQLQDIIRQTRELKALQEKPDSPETIAKLPRLTLADLDKKNKTIPTERTEAAGVELLYHDLFTNGIVYLELGMNLHVLPADLLSYVKLFGRALVEMGTETEDFVQLQQRIGRKTGGIYPVTFLSAKRGNPEAAAWLFLRGKATIGQAQEMLDIMRDVLLTVSLDNQERFKQMVLRAKAGLESGLVPSGHAVVNRRLRSYFAESSWAAEQMNGIEYLFFLRRLVEQVENDWPSVLAKLEAIRAILISRQNMLLNVTLDGGNWRTFRPQVADLMANMPDKAVEREVWDWKRPFRNEGLTIPAQVNYVAKGGNLYDLGFQEHGSVSPIVNYLRTTYLWEKVRVQGGAYGGMVGFSNYTGILSFYSYRDPNLLQTIDVYDNVAHFLQQPISKDDLTKSIIGAISGVDGYQLPDAKGYTAMSRILINSSDAYRQQMRDEILGTTAADYGRFAEAVANLADYEQTIVTVLGAAEAIDAANVSKAYDWLQVRKVL
ncbi:Predicted insulinase-like Zn-dependent peptidase DVU0941 [hydrothermal vent metagenome]|uniref:Predicted insulinase-like Zn-dependent peptidase DVU0941 n=1 Tax=hydrothermal vent metagenome TaxID=652676 RepID=A0A3B0UL72_9ZZZZ